MKPNVRYHKNPVAYWYKVLAASSTRQHRAYKEWMEGIETADRERCNKWSIVRRLAGIRTKVAKMNLQKLGEGIC